MTSQLLSIIMPAYNSAKTIAQSVESIVTQELSIPFELVIADDASGDETPALISTFQKKYKNIITLRNETNLGGGATRNKAIAFAKGDLLICLDSDDIMPPGMLEKMVRYLVEKDADGVLFEESRSFISNKSLTMSSKNPSELIGKKITFADLLTSDSFLTQVNFLYTRAAFNTVGGYPTTHGFDTQTFGHKFLALGLSAFICPDTFYYHRQGYGKSYFEREYETGALSRNYYYLLEEILYTFTPTVVESIFAYDIFTHSDISQDNLMSFVKKEFQGQKKNFLSAYESWEDCVNALSKKKNKQLGEILMLAVHTFHQGGKERSLELYQEVLKRGMTTPLVYYNLLRCLTPEMMDVDQIVKSLQLQPKISLVSQSLPRKILRRGWQLLQPKAKKVS